MNEYDWLTCEDSMPMLEYLHSNHAKIYQEWRSFVAGKAKDDGSTVRDYLEYVVKTINFGVYSKDAANLIREVVGNPFRPVVEKAHCKWCDTELPQPIPNSCPRCNTYNGKVEFWYRFIFIWITPSVRAFAQNIINSGDYNSVDVLADMLEEAGCDNEEILRHLRGEVRCAECGGDEIAIRDGPIFCTVCCNSGWLPKPIPCQPGCWVLRLLTEEK